MGTMLTPKQENFCLAYVETGNASEAYRRVYSVENMKPESVNRKAKELIDDGKVTARIEELRASAREAAKLTLEKHLRDLMKLRDEAQAQGQLSAAINAEIARGKAAGLYVLKAEVQGQIITPASILAELRAREGDRGYSIAPPASLSPCGIPSPRETPSVQSPQS
jgi:phage terminase small subunit